MPTAPGAPPPAHGCYDPGEGEASAFGLTMESSIAPAADGWLVRYRVVNASGSDRYLIADIPFPPFGGAYGPQNYYLTARTNGDIEIAKRDFWPTRSCVLPAMMVPPQRARMITLAAGQQFAEEFLVHRPMQIRHPFGSPCIPQLPPLPDAPARAVFCLGFTVRANPPGGDLDPGDQRFLCSDPVEL